VFWAVGAWPFWLFSLRVTSAARIRIEWFGELARWISEWRGLVGNKRNGYQFSCERLGKMKMETLSSISVEADVVYYFVDLFSPVLSNYQLRIMAGPRVVP
jgi:hypothetical protein